MEAIKNQIHEILENEDVGIFSSKTQSIVENTWERLGRFCYENYKIEDLFHISAPMLSDYLTTKYGSDLGALYLKTECSRILKLIKVFQTRGIDTQEYEAVIQKFKVQLQK